MILIFFARHGCDDKGDGSQEKPFRTRYKSKCWARKTGGAVRIVHLNFQKQCEPRKSKQPNQPKVSFSKKAEPLPSTMVPIVRKLEIFYSKAGNDISGDGSRSKPFRTLSRASWAAPINSRLPVHIVCLEVKKPERKRTLKFDRDSKDFSHEDPYSESSYGGMVTFHAGGKPALS